MNKETNTILANIIIAITKAQSAFMIIKATNSVSAAFVPVIAIVLLLVASFLIWKRNKIGTILAIMVIAFFLLQFFLLGLVQKMMVYFIIHLLAFGANVLTLKRMVEMEKSQRNI